MNKSYRIFGRLNDKPATHVPLLHSEKTAISEHMANINKPTPINKSAHTNAFAPNVSAQENTNQTKAHNIKNIKKTNNIEPPKIWLQKNSERPDEN